MIAYKTKGGNTYFKPTLEQAEEGMEESQGWCLACGEVQEQVEPDARGYECHNCSKRKVYGFEELVMMGLVGA